MGLMPCPVPSGLLAKPSVWADVSKRPPPHLPPKRDIGAPLTSTRAMPRLVPSRVIWPLRGAPRMPSEGLAAHARILNYP